MKTKYNYCPICGHKLVWQHESKHHLKEPKRQLCTNCQFVLYESTASTVSALILNNKKEVLLAKRNGPPNPGYWDAIGGFLEGGEHPITGLKREIKEEINVTLKDIKYFNIYMDTYYHRQLTSYTMNIYFTATIASGSPKASSDVAGVKWHSLKKLPAKIAFPNVSKALKDLVKKIK
ncbi:NUDIX hydrolase [Patescibacteria group bacterium]